MFYIPHPLIQKNGGVNIFYTPPIKMNFTGERYRIFFNIPHPLIPKKNWGWVSIYFLYKPVKKFCGGIEIFFKIPHPLIPRNFYTPIKKVFVVGGGGRGVNGFKYL